MERVKHTSLQNNAPASALLCNPVEDCAKSTFWINNMDYWASQDDDLPKTLQISHLKHWMGFTGANRNRI